MKSSAIVGLCTALLLTVLMSAAGGAINPILSYQGFLRDSNGVPYPDGDYEFTFTIYPDSIGGTALWSETQTLTVADGLVHASLGSVEALDQSVFSSAPLWLGVQLGTEPEFTPRHFIGSSVYAFVAADAEALGGFDAAHYADTTDLQQAVASHESDPQAHRPLDLDAAEIVSGTISPDRLPDLEVNSADVVDGSLQGADLADSVITGSKIAAGTIESEHLSDVAITGDQIVNGSITGADIQLAAIGFNQIEPQVISDYHIANTSISGFKLKPNTVSGYEIESQSIEASDLADNSIENRHIANSQVTALKIADEPGVREATGGLLTSVGTSPTSWFSITVDIPAAGYIIVFFNGYVSLQANEAAQVSLSTNPDTFDNRHVEARLSSGTSSFGGSLPMAVSTVFNSLSAGSVTIHVNVRATAGSAGPVDFVSGGMQAIYIPTIY